MGYTPHVLVVGGGPVGAGLARDFAIRGLEVTLVDRGPLADPRVGRMEGLLASGAQFARADSTHARRCLQENRTLFEIASHCVADTGGLVVDNNLDDLAAACEDCGIAARRVSGVEAREREPELSSTVDGALAVPDAAVDPYLLTVATARDAREYGADIRPRTAVTDIHVEDGTIDEVTLRHDPLPSGLDVADVEEGDDDSDDGGVNDTGNSEGDAHDDGAESDTDDGGSDGDGESDTNESEGDDGERGRPDRTDGETRADGGTSVPGKSVPGTLGSAAFDDADTDERPESTVEELQVDYVVNVAGADAPEIAALADCSLPVAGERETVVVTADRLVETAVTRTAGAVPDSVVPVGQHTLLATGDDPDDGEPPGQADPGESAGGGASPVPAPSAVDGVSETLSEVVPSVAEGRQTRAVELPRYAVEPGRGRDFVTVDHGDRDDCWGLLTVLGGTVTTHRWLAEQVCDRVCREFGIRRECRTDDLVLPGSEDAPDLARAVGTFGLAEEVYEHSRRRLGSQAGAVLHTDDANPVLCECQSVTRAEVRDALDDETTAEADLGGVRVRTSAATGECQGGRCAHRLAAELHPRYDHEVVEGACADLLAERWKGQRPLTGEQVTEMARAYRLHAATMNRRHDRPDLGHEDIARFDDDQDHATERPTCCPRVGWER